MERENKERKREHNWSAQEKDCLRELIYCNISIIESKLNDLKMIRKKKDAWEAIRMDMLASGFDRDVGKLKQQWVRMKVGAKKAVSEVRRATVATGNVAKIPKLDEGDLQIEAMLECEFLEDSILIDSDSLTPLPLSSGSPPPLLKHTDDAPRTSTPLPTNAPRTSTPLPTGKNKLISRLQNLRASSSKNNVLRERQDQIRKESSHEDELHLLKVEKIRAEILQQAELHELKLLHMKEQHAAHLAAVQQYK